jgi:hypothetical protein
MLKRLGYKVTIGIGILAWVTRYFLLAGSVNSAGAAQSALIFAAIVLHGVCYDFLFIAGQLYVDDEANERMRGAAQGFIAFILWGVGDCVKRFWNACGGESIGSGPWIGIEITSGRLNG